MGKSDIFWGSGSNFIWGGLKEGVGGGMGEKPKMRDFYFCKIPTIQQDTNFISQTVGQTNF